MTWNRYAVQFEAIVWRMNDECFKLIVRIVIFNGMSNAVFVPFLEGSNWDDSNTTERFKNMKTNLIINTASAI